MVETPYHPGIHGLSIIKPVKACSDFFPEITALRSIHWSLVIIERINFATEGGKLINNYLHEKEYMMGQRTFKRICCYYVVVLLKYMKLQYVCIEISIS